MTASEGIYWLLALLWFFSTALFCVAFYYDGWHKGYKAAKETFDVRS